MGFFSKHNPLKAHKKIASTGISATKSVAKAGVPKQSPAAGMLGGGGGSATVKKAFVRTGGVAPPAGSPGMRTGGSTRAMRQDTMQGPGPRMAEGGKVKKKK